MYCESCGAAMHWRCTDKQTNVSKFKCPRCGKVMTGVLEVKPPAPKPEPRFYYRNPAGFCVQKTTNHKTLCVGTFQDEETAKLVVDRMKDCGWDKTMIPGVFRELGIFRHKRKLVRA